MRNTEIQHYNQDREYFLTKNYTLAGFVTQTVLIVIFYWSGAPDTIP